MQHATVSAHILSTFTAPTTSATLDRMHHQGDTEAALDALKTELSTGCALFLFQYFYFRGRQAIVKKR